MAFVVRPVTGTTEPPIPGLSREMRLLTHAHLSAIERQAPALAMWLYKLLACELIGRYEDLKADRLRISATVRMA